MQRPEAWLGVKGELLIEPEVLGLHDDRAILDLAAVVIRSRLVSGGARMRIPTLYLFESSCCEFLAVSGDKTGCSIPKLADVPGWLLRREIRPHELPTDVVLTTYAKGFCMLDVDQLDPGTEFGPNKAD